MPKRSPEGPLPHPVLPNGAPLEAAVEGPKREVLEGAMAGLLKTDVEDGPNVRRGVEAGADWKSPPGVVL